MKASSFYRRKAPLSVILTALALSIAFIHHSSSASNPHSTPSSASTMSSVLLEEHFTTSSGTTPPAGWTSRTIVGAGFDIWRFDNIGNRTTSLQASAPFAGFDSDCQSAAGGMEDVTLESPAFNAPLNSTIILKFKQFFRSNPYGTSAVVEAFNGTTWSPVDSNITTTPDGHLASIDITREVAGVSNARIRFRYRGDYSWWWFIDDVVITETPLAPTSRLVFENFSRATGSTPPPGWSQNKMIGASWDNWRFDNPGGRDFTLPLSRPCAIFDSDTLSRLGGPEDVALESPAFSPRANATIVLRFNQFFRGDSGGRAILEVYNGTSWIQKWASTHSSPNPDTMCIDISNETAGKPNARVRFRWTAADWAWWWIVDNIEVLQTPNAGAGGIVSDNFNTPALDAGVWHFIDPLGDASLSMTGTQLRIALPAGVSHDVTEAGNLAPRVMQTVNDPQYFELFVKFDGLMDQAFQIQGIQIWQDSLNFLRLEYYGDGVNTNRLAWSFVNGVHQDVGSASIANAVVSPLYMKIVRHRDTWTQCWSTDGHTYNFGTSFTRQLAMNKIGLHAGNVGFPSSTAPAFVALFDYFLTGNPLPIQLARFSAVIVNQTQVRLDWTTISETNNYGFEIQKSMSRETGFTTLSNSFVPGNGTTTEPHNYTWTDANASSGRWFYRLKQLDLDGTVAYSEPVQVDIVTSVGESAPREFALFQNYPNPFNPSTEIRFTVEATAHASLEVFNMLGQRVATLFDDVAEAGKYYAVRLDAASLSSGTYFYRLVSGEKASFKKMILIK